MKLTKWLSLSYLILMISFLYAPIVILIIFSFNDQEFGTIWNGFTLRWYQAVFNDRQVADAVRNTLSIGIIAATTASIMGTLAAIGINNMRKGTKKVVLSLSSLPVATPDIVIGVSLMILYVAFFRLVGAGSFGFGTLLVSHIAFSIPYVILAVLPRFKNMNPFIYEAALDLGAVPFKAFFTAIVPQLMPGIVTGFLLAFTMSIDDFMVSFFTTGSGVSNLSLLIFSMTRRGVNPMVNALSTIMFLSVLILLFIINLRDSQKLKSRGE
ncbi:MAG: ABC transporter permease [Defluviitaleaceae bacterium]|nr:ABC transporter permease [Defluviitaleaceae bacterium]